ncbi:MAG: hypothetical protein IKY97_07765 [Mailhella sp.]|nr:hypothetical protein [Mailhella sp.]
MTIDWYVCMFFGIVIFFWMIGFFFVCLYAASALDDMKKSLEVMRHD